MTKAFIGDIEAFAKRDNVPLITFQKNSRKEELAAEYQRKFPGAEGILFIGKAQEKVKTFRTEGRRDPHTGTSYPWLVQSTAMVNQYYFYGLDEDFGPFFLKFSSYFPYTGRLCLNGHEYLKRQLAKEGIAYEPLNAYWNAGWMRRPTNSNAPLPSSGENPKIRSMKSMAHLT
jgi:hypothetical protein